MPYLESMKRMFPRELAEAVGYVALTATEAEEQIGELINLAHFEVTGLLGEGDAPRGWWASGTQLADALKRVPDARFLHIEERYRELFPVRNDALHSLWLSPKDLDMHFSMRRMKPSKDKPHSRHTLKAHSTIDSLWALAADFTELTEMVDAEITKILLPSRTGLKGLRK